MACSCRTKKALKVDVPYVIKPLLPCLFCALKHFATAMQLARLCGYLGANRTAIIGLLVLAQWHIYRLHYGIALQLRDIRHAVQNRQLSTIDSWTQVALLIDKVIKKHLLESNDEA